MPVIRFLGGDNDGRIVATITLSSYRVSEEISPRQWAERLALTWNAHDQLVAALVCNMTALKEVGSTVARAALAAGWAALAKTCGSGEAHPALVEYVQNCLAREGA